jgi:hypothetical protein
MLADGPFAEQFLRILRKIGTDRVPFRLHDNAAALLEPDIPGPDGAPDL